MATGELALAFSAGEGLSLAIVFTTFLFGLRHGIDWDHIAAITDITGSQETARKSPRFATLHAVGLGLVVLALGLLTIDWGLASLLELMLRWNVS
jgi:high-affinity nickel permease